jgi:undecaprenyl-diphosphatase
LAFDLSFFRLVNNLAGKYWPLDWLGIFLAEYLGYFLILGIVYLLIKEKNWRWRIYFFSLTTLSVILARGIITEIIKFFYYQPRPFLVLEIQPLIEHNLTSSFPSGHAAAFFALALVIFYFNKKWGWRCLILALLIGLARIFAGIHWPLDIIGGAIIGLISGLVIQKILFKFKSPASP